MLHIKKAHQKSSSSVGIIFRRRKNVTEKNYFFFGCCCTSVIFYGIFLALIFYIVYDVENRAIHLFLIRWYSQVLHYIICHLIYKGYHFWYLEYLIKSMYSIHHTMSWNLEKKINEVFSSLLDLGPVREPSTFSFKKYFKANWFFPIF